MWGICGQKGGEAGAEQAKGGLEGNEVREVTWGLVGTHKGSGTSHCLSQSLCRKGSEESRDVL